MSDLQNLNIGIVSLTFLRLIQGNQAVPTTGDDDLVRALGALAIDKRGDQTVPNKERPDCPEGIARGLLLDDLGTLKFSNAHIQELAETWSVAEHLQPDYVDRARMYDRAIRHLGRIGAGAVPLLVELLGCRETSVAKGAAVALGRIGDTAIPGLRWAILFGNARVRTYALESLSVMKNAAPLTDELLDLVATVLAEDGHAIVKDAAVAALSDTKR